MDAWWSAVALVLRKVGSSSCRCGAGGVAAGFHLLIMSGVGKCMCQWGGIIFDLF